MGVGINKQSLSVLRLVRDPENLSVKFTFPPRPPRSRLCPSPLGLLAARCPSALKMSRVRLSSQGEGAGRRGVEKVTRFFFLLLSRHSLREMKCQAHFFLKNETPGTFPFFFFFKDMKPIMLLLDDA